VRSWVLPLARIASESKDGTANIWTADGKLVRSLLGHEGTDEDIVLSRSDKGLSGLPPAIQRLTVWSVYASAQPEAASGPSAVQTMAHGPT